MIGRTASTKCRICRTLGILPVFLLACFVAWLANSATGWIWGIVAFSLILFCGTLALRSGCQLAFPDHPIDVSDDFADPEDFAPLPSSLQVEDLAPGELEGDREPETYKFDLTQSHEQQDSAGGSEAEQNIFEPEPEPEPEPDRAVEERSGQELTSNMDDQGQTEADPFVRDFIEDVTDEGLDQYDETTAFEDAERFADGDELTVPPKTDNMGYEDDSLESSLLPQAQSERPQKNAQDPGRRLAQNLVMVGASPALNRTPASNGFQSLRPASLNSARAQGPDDLKQIRGVGDALEELLHGMGYYHFDQIAAWTAEEVRWVDENLVGFKGRVSRDKWVAQASILAKDLNRAERELQMTPTLRPSRSPEHKN